MQEETKKKPNNFFTAKRLALIGIFSALSVGLYFINVPLSFLFPSFLKINVSDLPVLIGGFAMGPLTGGIIEIIKILIKLPFSDSMCVGELSDLLIGLSFILPATFFYKYHKTKKGALIGLIIGAVTSIFVAVIVNRLIIVPFYVKVMNIPFSALVTLCSEVLPNITEQNFYAYYLPLAVVPFNFLRSLLVGGITFLVYKRVSNLLRKF